MTINDRAMHGLIEESQDLQVDALRAGRDALPTMRAIGRERDGRPLDLDRIRQYRTDRRRVLKGGGMGIGALAARGLLGTAFGSAIASIVSRPVSAQADVDIQILQTAASLENLAVATYGAAIGLPFIQENAVVLQFAETTMAQHAEHGAAFNAQSEALGGARQEETNPVYTPIVEEATPTLVDALTVVNFAAVLEEVATDTYLANLSLLTTGDLRLLMGSVMGVESQHLATLRAVGALLEGGAPELIAIPTDVAALPAAAGSVAFPEPFEVPDMASPPEEGAVQ